MVVGGLAPITTWSFLIVSCMIAPPVSIAVESSPKASSHRWTFGQYSLEHRQQCVVSTTWSRKTHPDATRRARWYQYPTRQYARSIRGAHRYCLERRGDVDWTVRLEYVRRQLSWCSQLSPFWIWWWHILVKSKLPTHSVGSFVKWLLVVVNKVAVGAIARTVATLPAGWFDGTERKIVGTVQLHTS